jgi:hypothetical protein
LKQVQQTVHGGVISCSPTCQKSSDIPRLALHNRPVLGIEVTESQQKIVDFDGEHAEETALL